MVALKAPFPWFGGKSRAADLIWSRMGVVDNYVEPFAGSLAVLLGSPRVHRFETVNDKDGFVANFWRALQSDPEGLAVAADNPVNENDLHARHAWLVEQRDSLTARLEGDPEFFDAKIAGWWVWGISCWIWGGWCSGNGPWARQDGQLVHLGNAGKGVKRQLVHLGDAGQGVNRKRVHLGDAGQGGLLDWFGALADRLRHVRVCCGDWSRVCGPTPTVKLGVTGVVLDPPYALDIRDADCYSVDERGISDRVREWAISVGGDSRMRIALCGYEGEHNMPIGWACEEWRASGGYSSQGEDGDNGNKLLERIWFSPHCLGKKQGMLFGGA